MSGVKPKAKLYATHRRPPRRLPLHRLGLSLAALLALGGSGAFLWHVGWPQQQVARVADALYHLTSSAGFSLDDVQVEGRRYAPRDEVMGALQVRHGMPILAIDRNAILQRLELNPWIAAASIERRLPHTLHVRLRERQPFARWQFQNRIQVVDQNGKPLPPAAPRDFPQLPLVVGDGAAAAASELFTLMADYPKIRRALRAAVRVGDRRWDLILDPGITAKLPEGQEDSALERLASLIETQQVLNRKVIGIDLRAADRWAIERVPGSGAGNAKTAAGASRI